MRNQRQNREQTAEAFDLRQKNLNLNERLERYKTTNEKLSAVVRRIDTIERGGKSWVGQPRPTPGGSSEQVFRVALANTMREKERLQREVVNADKETKRLKSKIKRLNREAANLRVMLSTTTQQLEMEQRAVAQLQTHSTLGLSQPMVKPTVPVSGPQSPSSQPTLSVAGPVLPGSRSSTPMDRAAGSPRDRLDSAHTADADKGGLLEGEEPKLPPACEYLPPGEDRKRSVSPVRGASALAAQAQQVARADAEIEKFMQQLQREGSVKQATRFAWKLRQLLEAFTEIAAAADLSKVRQTVMSC